MENTVKKQVTVGDFVTRDDAPGPGSWMITDIVFNYERNVHQARIVKVGNPSQVEFVEPDTLTTIKKDYYK